MRNATLKPLFLFYFYFVNSLSKYLFFQMKEKARREREKRMRARKMRVKRMKEKMENKSTSS